MLLCDSQAVVSSSKTMLEPALLEKATIETQNGNVVVVGSAPFDIPKLILYISLVCHLVISIMTFRKWMSNLVAACVRKHVR